MADGYQLQYDAQGRPYYQFPGQAKNYVSPVAMGGTLGADTSGFWHAAPQWNNTTGKTETPFEWNKLISIAAAAGIAAPALAGALGGAGAAPLASGNFTALTPLSSAAGAAGSGAAAGTLASTSLPAAWAAGLPTAASVAPIAATTTGAGAGIMSSPNLWATLIGKGIDTATGLYGANKQMSANDRAAELQAQAMAAALKQQQDVEAERKREWDVQQQQSQAAWTAEQNRRAPYRQAGQNALVSLSQFAGLQAPSSLVAAPSDAPPPGWTPGSTSAVPINSLIAPSLTPGLSPTAPFAAIGPTPARKVAKFTSYGA